MAIKKPVKKHKADGLSDALAEAEKEPLKLFTIKIPLSQHTAFKAKVAQKHETMQEVLNRAIDEYLNS